MVGEVDECRGLVEGMCGLGNLLEDSCQLFLNTEDTKLIVREGEKVGADEKRSTKKGKGRGKEKCIRLFIT